jgi:multiple sugar transport system permease protein
MLCLAGVLVVVLSIWTAKQKSQVDPEGRQTLVFWSKPSNDSSLDDDTELLVRRFEAKYPQYHVIMSKAVARDLTGDAQRLMCTIAGGVPPDVVYFDRFAIGEWAARGALTDLRPMLEKQDKRDADYLDLSRYYDFTVAEASYRPPGSTATPGIYGIPCSTDIRVMFLNCDVLRQTGKVDERGNPRPPKNWDELRQYANDLTLFRVSGDKHSGIARLGFGPNSGNSWLYMYAWQAGGEMMNPERTKVTMDSPPVMRALRFMTDIYDDLGGVGQVQSFTEAQQGGVLDPFLRGAMAIKIDGDWSMSTIADWKPNLDFMCIPAPIPQDRIDAGQEPVAWSGGFAYVIPTTSKHKEGAFKLIRFMRTWDAVKLSEQGRREQREAEGRLFLPHIDVNRDFFERLLRESVDDNRAIPQTF